MLAKRVSKRTISEKRKEETKEKETKKRRGEVGLVACQFQQSFIFICNVTGKRATQVSERRTSTYYLDFNTLLLNTTKTHRGPQY
jgi:hypothetical protein